MDRVIMPLNISIRAFSREFLSSVRAGKFESFPLVNADGVD